MILSILCEAPLTSEMCQMGVQDHETGCEHGGCDLATVGTIADEGSHEAFTLDGIRGLSVSACLNASTIVLDLQT